MSAHIIFKPFIDKLLHSKETFLTANGIAEYFDMFNKENTNNFNSFKCKIESFGYRTLKNGKGKSKFCVRRFSLQICSVYTL